MSHSHSFSATRKPSWNWIFLPCVSLDFVCNDVALDEASRLGLYYFFLPFLTLSKKVKAFVFTLLKRNMN